MEENKNNIIIENATFNNTGYNCLEIGLGGTILPNNVTIQNCNFSGTFSNNAISIFGTQNNAEINIIGCHFTSVSNVLRLSNRGNATGVTVTFKDCIIEKWETNPNYAGMILCQDYTSTKSKVDTNNLFAPNKISITIIDCDGPNGAIYFDNDHPETVSGSKDTNQLIYVYRDKASPKLLDYDVEKYPTIICENTGIISSASAPMIEE